jgi:hypothetical protein
MAASRAEDGVPQAAAAHHALARPGLVIWVFHGLSALLRRPVRRPRAAGRAPLGAAARPAADLTPRPPIPFARLRPSSRSAADWSLDPVSCLPDAGDEPEESSRCIAPADRGRRPFGPTTSQRKQAACQDEPGGGTAQGGTRRRMARGGRVGRRNPNYRATEMGTGIREGEAPSEPLPDAGSHGGSPPRANSGPLLRGAVLSLRWRPIEGIPQGIGQRTRSPSEIFPCEARVVPGVSAPEFEDAACHLGRLPSESTP